MIDTSYKAMELPLLGGEQNYESKNNMWLAYIEVC